MNYDEVKTLALSYLDEESTETIDNMDNFLRIVESRINREVAVQEQVVESVTAAITGQTLYGLPSDFAGIRDIETYTPPDGARTTLSYLNPEQMNANISNEVNIPSYTIIANQFEITPAITGQAIKVTYYRRLPPLTPTRDTNWVSLRNPDLYIFGLLVEMASFKKDQPTAEMWNSRFAEAAMAINSHDESTRWSGTPLQVRLG